MSRAEDMSLLRRLQLVHEVNEDLRLGRDPYQRLKLEYDFWESSENMLRGGAEELAFVDELLRTLLARRPAPKSHGDWVRRLDRRADKRQFQSA